MTQCGNLRILLPSRFFVKSITMAISTKNCTVHESISRNFYFLEKCWEKISQIFLHMVPTFFRITNFCKNKKNSKKPNSHQKIQHAMTPYITAARSRFADVRVTNATDPRNWPLRRRQLSPWCQRWQPRRWPFSYWQFLFKPGGSLFGEEDSKIFCTRVAC